MRKSLIIVESPTKTKSFKTFLGPDYQVEASQGHVRDLPERELGVDLEDDFKPKYVTIPARKEILARLKAAAAKADAVYLATDHDREGEAIAWHLAQALDLKSAQRIQYNEVTRQAVEHAIQNPHPIDDARVNAQEARRVLDRIVGYRLSPLLWKKVAKNLSAGRVQSVAVRMICDREREIAAFVPEEYWSLVATLTPQSPEKQFPFEARFVGRAGKKLALGNEEQSQAILRELDGAAWSVGSVKKQERKRAPAPPFITSTLQQEASRKLGFSSSRTMRIAQQLYEGIDLGAEGSVGLITYMRTDSTRVAAEAQDEARRFIAETYGDQYVPPTPPRYKAAAAAQDAHEAIRSTSIYRTPEAVAERLSPEQMRLYRLIWQRFVASQMPPALFDVTTADIDANGLTFRATGSVPRFDGFMRVYSEGKDTEEIADEERAPLPVLTKGQSLDLLKLDPKQHFTEPPPRYTEATLVKAFEEKKIARPSTYATIISTIVDRKYVELREKRFFPTDLGMTVNDLLVKHFPAILDVGFTADMERKLDEVAGQDDKIRLLTEFYEPFRLALDEAHEKMERLKPEQVATEHVCPNCGKPMMLRQSARGPFLGCSGYPRCKTVLNTDGSPVSTEEKPKPVVSDQKCPKCGKPMIERSSAYGKFLGCSGYPKCKTVVQIEGAEKTVPTIEGIVCPKCGGALTEKRTRYGPLTTCSNTDACDFKSWLRLDARKCPNCGWPVGGEAYRGRPTGKVRCSNPDCDYRETGTTSPTED
jgi:DNA topoisomerase I